MAVPVRRIRTSSTNKRHVIFLYACAEHVEPSCAARSRFSPQLHNTGVDRAALLPPAMKSPRGVRTSWVAGHLLQQEVRRAGRRAPLRRRRAAFPQEPARLGLRGPAPCARRSAAEKVCGIDEALDLCRGRQAGLEPAHVASVAWLTMFIVSAPAQRARTSEVRPASCRWRCNSVSFPPWSFFLRVSRGATSFFFVSPRLCLHGPQWTEKDYTSRFSILSRGQSPPAPVS